MPYWLVHLLSLVPDRPYRVVCFILFLLQKGIVTKICRNVLSDYVALVKSYPNIYFAKDFLRVLSPGKLYGTIRPQNPSAMSATVLIKCRLQIHKKALLVYKGSTHMEHIT